MKNLIVLFIAFLFASDLFSQDSLVHKSGYVFRKGENVKMGIGTLINGDFKFVRISSQSLLWSQNESQNALPARFAGLNGEIANISQRGSKNRGFTD